MGIYPATYRMDSHRCYICICNYFPVSPTETPAFRSQHPGCVSQIIARQSNAVQIMPCNTLLIRQRKRLAHPPRRTERAWHWPQRAGDLPTVIGRTKPSAKVSSPMKKPHPLYSVFSGYSAVRHRKGGGYTDTAGKHRLNSTKRTACPARLVHINPGSQSVPLNENRRCFRCFI